MVKRFIIYLIPAAIVLFTACNGEFALIKGTLTGGLPGEYLYLNEFKSDRLEPVDSVKTAEDGSFSFRLKVKGPMFFVLKRNDNNFLTMLVEPGEEIFLRAHSDSLSYPAEVTGSEGSALLAEYNIELRKTIDRLLALNRIYEENEQSPELPALMNRIDSMAGHYLGNLNSYTRSYIDKNINSLASLVALYQQVAPGVPVLDQAKDWRYFVKVDSALYRKYPDYEPVITLHEQVGELVATLGVKGGSLPGSGVLANEISLPSPEGDTIKLSSTRGSVVLLDFWASWCPPCRKESPNLVAAYEKYHRKGFEIYQVSLDKTREAWLKGISDDKLGRWIHVSDLQYWNSSVVPLYKIESIPANYLLDKEGRIIASNLRGETLIRKLDEVFASN